jgi:gamma-glutamyl hercynylcysteine S-oxide synthase
VIFPPPAGPRPGGRPTLYLHNTMTHDPREATTTAADETTYPGSGWVQVGTLQVTATEVTVGKYRAFIEAGGYGDRRCWSERGWAWKAEAGVTLPAYWGQPGYDDDRLPVTGVSFWEAEAYANFKNGSLPTEQEWYDLASNGGRTRYPWGDDTEGIAANRANVGFFGLLRPTGLTPVNAFPKGSTPGGLWDLIGNVGEWCYPGTSAALVEGQAFGVLRGGCSWHTPDAVDATFRDEVPLTVRDNQTGFRLVRRVTAPRAARGRPAAPRAGQAPRRPIPRPTRPFRQEGIPNELTEAGWRLEVRGEVLAGRCFTLDELKTSFPPARVRGMFVCVCRWAEVNEVVGVRLADLVEAVRPAAPPECLYLRQFSAPGPGGKVYDAALPLADALADGAVLAYELDGRPLTPELGWPLRLFSFSFYGYKLVKCLARLDLSREFHPGWWEVNNHYDAGGVVRPGTVTVIGAAPYRLDIERGGAVPIPE